MFRWVSCQLDALENCLDYSTLKKSLVSLPKTLDETYTRILKNIPDEHKHHTVRILQFLTFSERPLQINEIVDAIAVQTEKARFDPENRMPVPEEISGYCSSLVAIVSSQNPRSGQTKTEIQLAHFSVKEYLLSKEDKGIFTDCLIRSNAEIDITRVVLVYLASLDGEYDPETDSDAWLPSRIGDEFPFAGYCAKYWMDHARIAEQGSEDIREQVFQFISRSNEVAYLNCLTLFNPDMPWEDFPELESLGPPLYYASLHELRYAVDRLISEGADANEVCENTTYGYALRAACEERHVEVVRILLDGGVCVDTFGGENGSTALVTAVSEGLEGVARQLLDRDADPNIKGSYYDTDFRDWAESHPLEIATSKGSETLVEMLLEKGADVNDENGVCPALISACSEDHEEVVRLLLHHGATVTARNSDQDNALTVASQLGHKGVVHILLEHPSSDPCMQDVRNDALIHARPETKDGQMIIEELLDNGADINSLSTRYGKKMTALECAVAFGQEESGVLFLAEKGASLFRISYTSSNSWTFRESPDGSNKRLFQVACQHGWVDLVRFLLSRNTGVQHSRGLYGDGLQTASYWKHEDIVKFLLSNGSDVDAEPGEYGNALHAASSRGHLGIVECLLEQDADPNRMDRHGWSALSIAMKHGHTAVFEKLLPVSNNTTLIASHNSYRCLAPSTFVTPVFPSKVRINSDERTVEADYDNDRKLVYADHPFPPTQGKVYFEIKILQVGAESAIGVGLYQEESRVDKGMPGWYQGSWGFHSDDGEFFNGDRGFMQFRPRYGSTFGANDVVGCGVDYGSDQLFFTLNGHCLGPASKAPLGKLFAAIGIRKGGRVSFNFGASYF